MFVVSCNYIVIFMSAIVKLTRYPLSKKGWSLPVGIIFIASRTPMEFPVGETDMPGYGLVSN